MVTRSVVDWERILSSEMGVAVTVSYGRSRCSPIQVRWNGNSPAIRFHRMFADAPAEIEAATVAWIRNGRRARRACRELDAWIQAEVESLPAQPARRVERVSAGTTHDLGALAAELLGNQLAGEFSSEQTMPALTWGRRAKSRSRHTLQLGSYSPESHLVRVHPVLDQDAVPAWFTRYVVFHEFLHALVPAKQVGSRRWRHHCPEFRRRESAYADYHRAILWEKQNLAALIRSARSGKPMPSRRTRAASLVEALQGLLFPA